MFSTLPTFSNVSMPFKPSSLGLFHGKVKQYGNNVPHSLKKTRRTWLPNVQSKRLMSEVLGKMVKVKLTTSALRTIKKHGGIDQYLLRTNPDLLGFEGMHLRLLVREKLEQSATLSVPENRPKDGKGLLDGTPAAQKKDQQAQKRPEEVFTAGIFGAGAPSSMP
ncbi:hypothetical protein F5I97DRAFT_1901017 [Phlebopus sp. FC_14]|nr:hypothetical protein F5I97DRAFT_1901017 [Phlebopus sp. FC_14]